MNNKLKEWFWRYIPAEISGISLSVLSIWIFSFFTGNIVVLAYVATWVDNLGYYGYILKKEIQETYREYKRNKKTYSFFSFIKNIFHLLLEFGPAEILDSFVLRPMIIGFCLYFFSSQTLAVFVGNILANITFYIPTIISYEMKKKYIKKS